MGFHEWNLIIQMANLNGQVVIRREKMGLPKVSTNSQNGDEHVPKKFLKISNF